MQTLEYDQAKLALRYLANDLVFHYVNENSLPKRSEEKLIILCLILIAFLPLVWPGWPSQALAQTAGSILLPVRAWRYSFIRQAGLFAETNCGHAVLSVSLRPCQSRPGKGLLKVRSLPDTAYCRNPWLEFRSRLFPTTIRDLEMDQVKLTAQMDVFRKKKGGTAATGQEKLNLPAKPEPGRK